MAAAGMLPKCLPMLRSTTFYISSMRKEFSSFCMVACQLVSFLHLFFVVMPFEAKASNEPDDMA